MLTVNFKRLNLCTHFIERPKILHTSVIIRNPQGIERFISNAHNTTVVLDESTLKDFKHGHHSVLLVCSAPYHVQWKYRGNGVSKNI